MTDLDKRDSPSLLVQAGGAGLAAFLALGTGPLAPLLAPVATPLTTRMVERIAAELRRKTQVVEECALGASGLDPDSLSDALTGDPDLIALTQKVLEAAATSGNEQKLRGLGELLGRVAANPGDRLEETQVLVAALADLEAPHLLVLDVLTRQPPDQGTTPGELGWQQHQVEACVNLDPHFVLACLNTLTRHGLAETDSSGIGQRFRLTRLGQAIARAGSW